MCSIFGIFGLQPGDDLQDLRRATKVIARSLADLMA